LLSVGFARWALLDRKQRASKAGEPELDYCSRNDPRVISEKHTADAREGNLPNARALADFAALSLAANHDEQK
jgi:hypothetical protein